MQWGQLTVIFRCVTVGSVHYTFLTSRKWLLSDRSGKIHLLMCLAPLLTNDLHCILLTISRVLIYHLRPSLSFDFGMGKQGNTPEI